mgnify:CR=1 FL=1
MKGAGRRRRGIAPATLRDGLAGSISEAVAKALLTGTLWPGAAWRGLLWAFGLGQMHMILSLRGHSVET